MRQLRSAQRCALRFFVSGHDFSRAAAAMNRWRLKPLVKKGFITVGQHPGHIILRSDGSTAMFTTRCRNSSREDRATYYEVKEGKVGANEFARLAWTIERSGFFSLKSEYYRNMTEAVFESTRVVRDGKTVEVSNYASAGPLEMWNIQKSIEGVWAGIEVHKTARRAICPKW